MDRAKVAELAYRYYLERGCEPGGEHEDWLRAERELLQRAGESGAPSRVVAGVFHSMEQAQRAFDRLTSEGFSRDTISFIANKAGVGEWTEPSHTDERETMAGEAKMSNVAGDAGIGAAIGGVGGLLLSFAGIAIPGVGPVLAAGPIVAALGGAGLGAAAGGLIGVLVESGVPEEDAGSYAESVRRGGILITVRAQGGDADRAARILDEHGAVDIDDRVSDWRTRGWSGHESAAAPLTEDELRREREYFAAARRQGAELSALAKGKKSRPKKGQTPAEPRRSARIYGS